MKEKKLAMLAMCKSCLKECKIMSIVNTKGIYCPNRETTKDIRKKEIMKEAAEIASRYL